MVKLQLKAGIDHHPDGSRLGTGRDAMNTTWSQNPLVPAPTSSVFDSTAVRTWVLLTSGG